LSKKTRTVAVWALLVLLFVAAYTLVQDTPARQESFQTFMEHLETGYVSQVRVDGNEISVELYGGVEYETLGVIDEALTRTLSEQGVVLAWGKKSDPLKSAIKILVPLVIVLALVLFFLRRMQAGGMSALELRKSRARLLSASSGVTFADVGGCEEAKEQLRDLVDFLKCPERWTGAGVRLPRGVLLEGAPGCGKTLLGRAVAGETDARFYLVSASEFVEMFVGVGAARVRDMFEIAAKEAPSVIFIDELDAIGRRRGTGIGAGHDEREQTLNQILVCMDGFESHDRVVVIAATNRSDILDPALLRPGRFDRRVRIPPLDGAQRVEVLEIHTRNKTLAPDVSLEVLSERTEDFSGAELESLVNEAGLLAVRRARRRESDGSSGRPANGAAVSVAWADFEEALQPRAAEVHFDRVDALLIESTTQLARARGCAQVRLKLEGGDVVEGEVVWADASFLKLRSRADGSETIVPKQRVTAIEALAGTEAVPAEEVVSDPWAARIPDLA
jgi:cell division protease FtsH